MATIRQFEDLLCWQRSRELTKEVYKTLKDCKDFGFKDQIQRASVSVMKHLKYLKVLLCSKSYQLHVNSCWG